MHQKKLAVLLAAAVVVGQFSIFAAHSAQANPQSPKPSPFTLSPSVSPKTHVQVASMIDRLESIPEADDAVTEARSIPGSDTGEIYTLPAKPGGLKTLIQVLPQSGNDTSLFVNGTEILRLHGTVNDATSHERVRAMAERLYQKLTDDAANGGRIRADHRDHRTLVIGDSPLLTVDACTASAAKANPDRLALLYADRLRHSLGQPGLSSPFRGASPETGLADENDNHAAPPYRPTGKRQAGVASWYGGFFHGRRTASGSRFNQYALTAAHRTLPFGTMVRVVNQRNHKSCVVKITDRGPYAHGRIIDLSRGAAQAIGMPGVARVVLEVVRRG
jgi:rare lipoprotein A